MPWHDAMLSSVLKHAADEEGGKQSQPPGQAQLSMAAIELHTESHFRKALQGHFSAFDGVCGHFRHVGEHEVAKVQLVDWFRSNTTPKFQRENRLRHARMTVEQVAKNSNIHNLMELYTLVVNNIKLLAIADVAGEDVVFPEDLMTPEQRGEDEPRGDRAEPEPAPGAPLLAVLV